MTQNKTNPHNIAEDFSQALSDLQERTLNVVHQFNALSEPSRTNDGHTKG